MDADKERFIKLLRDAYGIVSAACDACGISRSTYYNWKDNDPEFRAAAEDVLEVQGDFVESQLLKNIANGDTTSIIFYCKTKLKNRGYTERQPKEQPRMEEKLPAKTVTAPKAEDVPAELLKKIESKKSYIVRMLKKQGKYSVEMSYQATLVAQLLVKTDELAKDIFSEAHSPVSVEYSREGDKREQISQKEKLYLDYVANTQKALKAIGMNLDSKDKKQEDDGFGSFLAEFGKTEDKK